MVPSLSSSKKPNTNGIPILTLFSIELEPSFGQQDTDITLEGQDPVFPRATNMMFIVPRGGLEDASPQNAEPVWLPGVRISALKSYCMMLCMLLCMTLCMN